MPKTTINDFKKYLDKLVEEGKGECIVKKMYDGMIQPVHHPKQVLEQMEQSGKGVISGEIKKGEFLIES